MKKKDIKVDPHIFLVIALISMNYPIIKSIYQKPNKMEELLWRMGIANAILVAGFFLVLRIVRKYIEDRENGPDLD